MQQYQVTKTAMHLTSAYVCSFAVWGRATKTVISLVMLTSDMPNKNYYDAQLQFNIIHNTYIQKSNPKHYKNMPNDVCLKTFFLQKRVFYMSRISCKYIKMQECKFIFIFCFTSKHTSSPMQRKQFLVTNFTDVGYSAGPCF